jgi:integrase
VTCQRTMTFSPSAVTIAEVRSPIRSSRQHVQSQKHQEQEAARKRSRYGHRDATMILVAYRHGLRASEVCNLRWDQIDLGSGRLHVRRAKGGIDNVHPLSGREIRALRQLRRENTESRYVFVTERGGPATTAGFLKTIARTGDSASISRSYGFLTAQWSSPIRSAFRLVSCSLPHCAMCAKNCRVVDDRKRFPKGK